MAQNDPKIKLAEGVAFVIVCLAVFAVLQNLPPFPPVLSLLTPEEITLFTPPYPFIYMDSA